MLLLFQAQADMLVYY